MTDEAKQDHGTFGDPAEALKRAYDAAPEKMAEILGGEPHPLPEKKDEEDDD